MVRKMMERLLGEGDFGKFERGVSRFDLDFVQIFMSFYVEGVEGDRSEAFGREGGFRRGMDFWFK